MRSTTTILRRSDTRRRTAPPEGEASRRAMLGATDGTGDGNGGGGTPLPEIKTYLGQGDVAFVLHNQVQLNP